MKKFFSFDGEGYLAFHDTADEAREVTENALEDEQDTAADDGWRDEVEAICWGEIRQHVVLTKSTPTPEGRFDSLNEYELVDVGPSEEVQELREMQRLYREQARCACGEDEACLFVRQRDEARQKLAAAKEHIKSLVEYTGGDEDFSQ